MTPETFYAIAIWFIAFGSVAGVVNTILQYYDIILDKKYNSPEKPPLTLVQLIVIICCRKKPKGR